MEIPHPHIGSGMSLAAAGVALLGAFSFGADPPASSPHVVVARSAAAVVSFDDVKWGISMAVSFVFGSIGVYQHVIERIEKGRYKRQADAARAKLAIEEMEAKAKGEREAREMRDRIAREETEAKARLALEEAQAKARLVLEEREADSKLRRERAADEMRLTLERAADEVRRHLVDPQAPPPTPPAVATGTS